MSEYWIKVCILGAIIIGVMIFSWWQTSKTADDFYEAMYGEDYSGAKDTTKEKTDRT